MLEIGLADIVRGVIVDLILYILTGVGFWIFRQHMRRLVASLYALTTEAISVPYSLCSRILRDLTRLFSDVSGVVFSAVFSFQFSVSHSTSGGEGAGKPPTLTAPTVSIRVDCVQNTYSATHHELVAECRKRYSDFKQNSRFNNLMKAIKFDPNCACERRLNPKSGKSIIQMRYNLDATLAKLDDEYTKRK